jgi:methylenetetrahydrofolate reductase (NADPH)
MSGQTGSTATEDGDRALLRNPRYELMPFDSFGEQMELLPDGASITVTTSPTLGLDATLEWTERAAEEGYEMIPHIAARYVEDEDHLDEVAARMMEADVAGIFVPGGDRDEPIGEFESAHELLLALEGLGYEFDEVGITGYPEGHHFLETETLVEAMQTKAPHATYIVTQLCYDPDAIVDWLEAVRTERDVDLPVEVGIPGVLKYQRLLGISSKVGVGDSVEFLKKTSGITGFIRQFVGSRGKYTPDPLVDGLAPYWNDEAYNIRGLHIYTFNQSADTEAWRRERLGE